MWTLITIGIILIIFILVKKYAWDTNPNVQFDRSISKLPNRLIRHAENGKAIRLTGRVKLLEEPVMSPLSGKPCAYFKVIVEEKVADGRVDAWKTIIEHEEGSAFGIAQGEDMAIVPKTTVKSRLAAEKVYYSTIFEPLKPVLEEYLQKFYKPGFQDLERKHLRYEEGILEEGEQVTVLGKGEWSSRIAVDYNLPSKNYLVLAAIGRNPIHISDEEDYFKK